MTETPSDWTGRFYTERRRKDAEEVSPVRTISVDKKWLMSRKVIRQA